MTREVAAVIVMSAYAGAKVATLADSQGSQEASGTRARSGGAAANDRAEIGACSDRAVARSMPGRPGSRNFLTLSVPPRPHRRPFPGAS